MKMGISTKPNFVRHNEVKKSHVNLVLFSEK